MTAYLDASAIVPQFVEDIHSPCAVKAMMALTDKPIVSALAIGEVISAISRLARTGALAGNEPHYRVEAFDTWIARFPRTVEIDDTDLLAASLLVRRFDLGLRMPDAVHVAVCRRHAFDLITFDRIMFRAAMALGVAAVIPA